MKTWNTYPHFTEEHIKQHHEIVLADVFHQIKAYILYPPCYSCEANCDCGELRAQVILSLNVAFLKEAEVQKRKPEYIAALKALLKIPEDSYFRDHWNTAYPLWLINQDFEKKEAQGHFKIVDRLVWTLLRLGRTYEESFLGERRASLTETIEKLVGDKPLKSDQAGYLCGEKAYGKHFKDYKSVCHFVAAFEFMRRSEEHGDFPFSLSSPSPIEWFLQLSHFFREELLLLKTPNIKKNTLLSKELLISLPPWVSSQVLGIPIEPFPEMSDKLKASLVGPCSSPISHRLELGRGRPKSFSKMAK